MMEAMDPLELERDMIAWRRHLHGIPETGFEERQTAEFVAGTLASLGLEVARGIGGTGVTFDWAAARTTLFQNAEAQEVKTRLIAAGGLNPANVAEAVAALRPWGVDVASGVEAAPGRKDPAKVREFVARARTGRDRS